MLLSPGTMQKPRVGMSSLRDFAMATLGTDSRLQLAPGVHNNALKLCFSSQMEDEEKKNLRLHKKGKVRVYGTTASSPWGKQLRLSKILGMNCNRARICK